MARPIDSSSRPAAVPRHTDTGLSHVVRAKPATVKGPATDAMTQGPAVGPSVILDPPAKWVQGPPSSAPVFQTRPVEPVVANDPQLGAEAIAARVSQAFYAGPKELHGRLGEMDALAQIARFTPEGLRAHTVEHAAIKLALEGGAAVKARVEELENLLMVALFTPEGSAEVQLELDVLRLLSKNFEALTARAEAVSPEAMPVDGAAENIEASVLRTLHGGYGAVEAQIANLEDLKTRARFTPEGLRAVEAELTVLNALLGGVPAVTAKREELRQFGMVARLDEAAMAKLQLELDVLARIEAATAHFAGPAHGAN